MALFAKFIAAIYSHPLDARLLSLSLWAELSRLRLSALFYSRSGPRARGAGLSLSLSRRGITQREPAGQLPFARSRLAAAASSSSSSSFLSSRLAAFLYTRALQEKKKRRRRRNDRRETIAHSEREVPPFIFSFISPPFPWRLLFLLFCRERERELSEEKSEGTIIGLP